MRENTQRKKCKDCAHFTLKIINSRSHHKCSMRGFFIAGNCFACEQFIQKEENKFKNESCQLQLF